MNKGKNQKDFNLEHELALEEVSMKNARAILEYSRDTRKQFVELQKRFDNLQNMVLQQNSSIEHQKQMIVGLLIKTEKLV